MNPFRRLAELVARDGAAVLVSVTSVEGSAPREAGAWMAVSVAGDFFGTIGGGALEWEAVAQARKMFGGDGLPLRESVALGPARGQCCGGRVALRYELFGAADLALLNGFASAPLPLRVSIEPGADGRLRRSLASGTHAPTGGGAIETYGEAMTPLMLFGAGHVAAALVIALAPLPFAVRWIDSRADMFPAVAPANVQCVATDNPAVELARAQEGSMVLIMTHSHALDFDIAAAALRLPHVTYVGLIGSTTKRARFVSQLRAGGLPDENCARLICPIGAPGIAGKAPAIIAASVAADLLVRRSRQEEEPANA